MKKRKLKKKPFIIVLVVLLLLIAIYYATVLLVVHSSDEYVLESKGYSTDEYSVLVDNYDLLEYALEHDYDQYLVDYINYEDVDYSKIGFYSNYVNLYGCSMEDAIYLMNNGISYEYSEDLINIVKEKYFLKSRLDRYLEYKKNNLELSYKEVVTLVNCNRDYEYYTYIQLTDTSYNNLLIANKYYQLKNDYTSSNLVYMGTEYATGSRMQVDSVAYEAFKKLHDDAKNEGYSIIAASTYRTYDRQAYLYNRSVTSNGQTYADKYSARAGHSEHQTGLAIDVLTRSTYSLSGFVNTKEYKWMLENCYKYGFILRYPEDKTNETGYSFESWHYRYVGVEAATIIHDENITFDEYYAYYVIGE